MMMMMIKVTTLKKMVLNTRNRYDATKETFACSREGCKALSLTYICMNCPQGKN